MGAGMRTIDILSPEFPAVVNYRLDGLSVEKLMAFIVALGRDVEIIVRSRRGDAVARVSVLEAG